MIEYLLDSDIAIYIMNGRHPSLSERLDAVAGRVGMSSIAYSELAFGMERSQRREENFAALGAFVRRLTLLPYEPEAGLHYAQIRTELQRLGTPVGSNDMLIAAHARSLDVTLVTNNRREFDRIPGLKVENWV